MDQRDEFSKWMSSVEEALKTEGKEELEENVWSEETANECGCAKWDCPTCFPDQDVHPGEHKPPITGGGEETPDVIVVAAEPTAGLGAPAVCPHCGFPHGGDEDHGYDEEIPLELAQENQYADLDNPEWTNYERGENSPLTYGECNLERQPSSVVHNHDNDYMREADDEMGEPGQSAQPGQEDDEYAQSEALDQINQIIYHQDSGLSNADHHYTREELVLMPPDKIQEIHSQVTGSAMAEDMQDEEMLVPPSQTDTAGGLGGRGGALGGAGMGFGGPSMGGGGGGGGGKYPPGTAPTMPESIQKGKSIMENVDKDVEAMLQSLKKYDKLMESRAPVLGLKTMTMVKEGDKPDFLDVDKDDNKKESWKKAEKDKKEEVDEKASYDLAKGKKVEEEEKEEVDESTEADADVLAWMDRFAKLGNMKGYGR